MQGTVLVPKNPQQGSSPPQTTELTNMDLELRKTGKEDLSKSQQNDSGFFSTTANTTNCDSDNRSDCSSPERKYICPICDMTLTASHDFTLHIRSHNNDAEEQNNEKGFTCKICNKILSSSSSLDRHVLVHSGERPFVCKYCGDTFTTNGNMHRHMRTHSSKVENYESDGSTESDSVKSTEYNNNKVDEELNNNKRKMHLEDLPNKRHKSDENGDQQNFKCVVCERDDFTTLINLNSHMKDNHPEYPATCTVCKQVFTNNKLLRVHETIAHEMSTPKNTVPGFKDLTFVDFTSNKFTVIAKHECETNLHTVSSGLRFECDKCLRAFPCSSSLEIHSKNCTDKTNWLNSSKLKNFSEDEIRRRDFFSRLNLQNNLRDEYDSRPQSPVDTPNKLKEQLVKVMDNTKDLADIQSILSNINLQKIQNKHNEPKEDLDRSNFESSDLGKNEGEEEAQDSFAIEFRKMKLRGEFPCRLCTAVFPNLRALKGHNRAHLNGNSSGTYFCNMCPHSSIDKAALIRHMRTHNGDRPYECSICNYAFTTKANCERHLRNRHSKTTREEVKKSIIYHPSEDPTNEDLNKLNFKAENKNSSFNSPIEKDLHSPVKIHCSTPKTHSNSQKPEVNLKPVNVPLIPDPSTRFPNAEFLRNVNIKQFREQGLYQNPMSNILSPSVEIFTNKFQNNNLPVEKNNPPRIPPKMFVEKPENYYSSHSEEALDLSTKKVETSEDETPEDLSKKKLADSPEIPNFSRNFTELLHQQLLNVQPKIDPATLYATQLAQMYRNGFSGWPGFPVNPLLFSALPGNLPPHPQEIIKERIQRFQLYGGSVISEDFKSVPSTPLPQTGVPVNLTPLKIRTDLTTGGIAENTPKNCANTKELTPKSCDIETGSKVNSPATSLSNSDIMHSPNSVKMVIKNGVLMPKQKQRRYRTERPFTCEHCSAKFTLRSNMERHIKQQHPQYWSQRHRNNIIPNNGNNKKIMGIPMKPYELNVPNFEMSKLYDYSESKEHIGEKLKYAILAQQLKISANEKQEIKKEDDDDYDLVIDENEEKSQHFSTHKSEHKIFTSEKLHENVKHEEDLVPVSRLLDNASQQQFKQFFKREPDESEIGGVSEEDEEGLVAGGSTSEENISDENRSESETAAPPAPAKKQSAYSLAPNRVSCPYCSRKFPWTSSLRRHILTHTGQKPFKCSHCPLLFTTKSNCDRHLLRKHGNSATTICNDSQANGNLNHLLRNVPERPFKCSHCPSSTFSTYSNLKKHISEKHPSDAQSDEIKAQGYEAGSSEDEKVNHSETKTEYSASFSKFAVRTEADFISNNNQIPNSDLPFKCHLCEGSFGERQEALDHIRDKHASEYDLLMSKNALEVNATVPDDPTHNEDDDDIRGKFPDYSNRKVICAWCMRRFWSAEDLRRHMRTHTGERPFSCDICRRRFTLKHSMLRHRKKHNLNQTDNDTTVSDEDVNVPTAVEKLIAEKSLNLTTEKRNEKTDESDGNEGDLISNLLGIRDRSIIDRVLGASADDAAKLLGVKNNAK